MRCASMDGSGGRRRGGSPTSPNLLALKLLRSTIPGQCLRDSTLEWTRRVSQELRFSIDDDTHQIKPTAIQHTLSMDDADALRLPDGRRDFSEPLWDCWQPAEDGAHSFSSSCDSCWQKSSPSGWTRCGIKDVESAAGPFSELLFASESDGTYSTEPTDSGPSDQWKKTQRSAPTQENIPAEMIIPSEVIIQAANESLEHSKIRHLKTVSAEQLHRDLVEGEANDDATTGRRRCSWQAAANVRVFQMERKLQMVALSKLSKFLFRAERDSMLRKLHQMKGNWQSCKSDGIAMACSYLQHELHTLLHKMEQDDNSNRQQEAAANQRLDSMVSLSIRQQEAILQQQTLLRQRDDQRIATAHTSNPQLPVAAQLAQVDKMVRTAALARLGRSYMRCQRDSLFRIWHRLSANFQYQAAHDVLSGSCHVQHELHGLLQKTKQANRIEKHRLLELALELERKLQNSSDREHALYEAIEAGEDASQIALRIQYPRIQFDR